MVARKLVAGPGGPIGRSRTAVDTVFVRYSYDAMNRLHTITYSGGVATPNVTYTYDTAANGLGRLTNVTTAATTMTISGQSYAVAATTQQILGYDPVGRVTGSQTTVGSTTLPAFSYTYNLADALLTETYPTGRTVSTCYDVAGRITGVSNGASTTCSSSPYLSAATYAPHGAPTAYQYGNSVYRAMSYNSHLQPYELQDTYPGSSGSNLLNLTYYFGGSTTLGQSNAQNNGSPTKIGISSAAGNFTQTYTYDHLKRLTQATDSSWSQGFSYDAYGNMWQSSGSALPTEPLMPTLQSSINAASNQFVSTFAGTTNYDSAGNLTQTGSGAAATTWTYDAESRQVLISPGAQYQYDGLGQRLLKTVNGNTTTYAYDVFGNLAVEYDPAGTTPLACTTTCYVSTDHLGSARMVTDQGGTVKGLHDYLPFGTETNVGRSDPIVGAADGVNQKFTGQDRDSDSPRPQDHFPARYYTSGMGRFMSPDPVGNLIGDPANPQTWNPYIYALNNPLGNVDPTGLDPISCFSSTDPMDDSPNPTVYTICLPPNPAVQPPPDEQTPVFTVTGTAKAPPNDIADNARCAAASASSIASLVGISNSNWLGQALLGNDFSTASNLLFGPRRLSSAGQAALSSPLKYNLINHLAARVGAIDSGKGRWLNIGSLDELGNPSAVFKGLSFAQTAAGKAISEAAGVFTAAKLTFDAGAYAYAYAKCAGVIH